MSKVLKIASSKYFLQYFKNEGIKLIFCMQINIKPSYKLMPLIMVGMARYTQITQKNKFAKFCNISKFLHFGPILDKIRSKMANNCPKWSVLDFNQNWVVNIGWNHFQMMNNIIFYNPVQTMSGKTPVWGFLLYI